MAIMNASQPIAGSAIIAGGGRSPKMAPRLTTPIKLRAWGVALILAVVFFVLVVPVFVTVFSDYPAWQADSWNGLYMSLLPCLWFPVGCFVYIQNFRSKLFGSWRMVMLVILAGLAAVAIPTWAEYANQMKNVWRIADATQAILAIFAGVLWYRIRRRRPPPEDKI